MGTLNLNQPQSLWGNPENLPVPAQKSDVRLETGMILRWSDTEQQYFPVIVPASPDIEFENVEPVEPRRAAPKRDTEQPPAAPQVSNAAYFHSAVKLAIFTGGIMTAIGIIKISIAVIEVVIEGIYAQMMPALFRGMVEAGYYLGIGIGLLFMMYLASALIRSRSARTSDETEKETVTESKSTTNIFQWFIVNDADNAQQTVDQFKNKIS
jgi:hypothetical protein